MAISQLDEWHWNYVLHQKGKFLIRDNESQPWCKLHPAIERHGQYVWAGEQQLTAQHIYLIWRALAARGSAAGSVSPSRSIAYPQLR